MWAVIYMRTKLVVDCNGLVQLPGAGPCSECWHNTTAADMARAVLGKITGNCILAAALQVQPLPCCTGSKFDIMRLCTTASWLLCTVALAVAAHH